MLYERLGHSFVKTFALIIKNTNMNVSTGISHCGVCSASKSCKLPFKPSEIVYHCPIDLVEMDLSGPAPVTSNNFLYNLSVVDVYFKYSWV